MHYCKYLKKKKRKSHDCLVPGSWVLNIKSLAMLYFVLFVSFVGLIGIQSWVSWSLACCDIRGGAGRRAGNRRYFPANIGIYLDCSTCLCHKCNKSAPRVPTHPNVTRWDQNLNFLLYLMDSQKILKTWAIHISDACLYTNVWTAWNNSFQNCEHLHLWELWYHLWEVRPWMSAEAKK